MSSGFEVVIRFTDGHLSAVARLDAETFEEAAASALLRVPGREVKTLEITDLRFEDREAAGAA